MGKRTDRAGPTMAGREREGNRKGGERKGGKRTRPTGTGRERTGRKWVQRTGGMAEERLVNEDDTIYGILVSVACLSPTLDVFVFSGCKDCDGLREK